MGIGVQLIESAGQVQAMVAARGALWGLRVVAGETRRREVLRYDRGRWSPTEWAGPFDEIGLWSDARGAWVRYGTLLRRLDVDGSPVDLRDAVPAGETIDKIASLDDDLIVGTSRRRTGLHASVSRVDARGVVRWCQPLRAEPLPRSLGHIPTDRLWFNPGTPAATRDLVAITYDDARYGLALSFGFSADDGTPCWVGFPGIGRPVTALDETTVAVGCYEDDQAPRTRAYRRGGEVTCWPSVGAMVRLDGAWFVAESGALHRRAAWVRLLDDGAVERGGRLPDASMTDPIVIGGNVFFARSTALWCARPDLTVHRVATIQSRLPASTACWGPAAVLDGSIYVGLERYNAPTLIWRIEVGDLHLGSQAV
jgi:hypothetical protein